MKKLIILFLILCIGASTVYSAQRASFNQAKKHFKLASPPLENTPDEDNTTDDTTDTTPDVVIEDNSALIAELNALISALTSEITTLTQESIENDTLISDIENKNDEKQKILAKITSTEKELKGKKDTNKKLKIASGVMGGVALVGGGISLGLGLAADSKDDDNEQLRRTRYPHCEIFNTNGTCKTCSPDYKTIPGEIQCVKDIRYCEEWSPDKEKCARCQNNYIPTPTGNSPTGNYPTDSCSADRSNTPVAPATQQQNTQQPDRAILEELNNLESGTPSGITTDGNLIVPSLEQIRTLYDTINDNNVPESVTQRYNDAGNAVRDPNHDGTINGTGDTPANDDIQQMIERARTEVTAGRNPNPTLNQIRNALVRARENIQAVLTEQGQNTPNPNPTTVPVINGTTTISLPLDPQTQRPHYPANYSNPPGGPDDFFQEGTQWYVGNDGNCNTANSTTGCTWNATSKTCNCPNQTTIPVITGNGTTTNRPDANGDHKPDEPEPDPDPNRDNYVHQGEDWYEINQNTCTLLTGYVLIGTECKSCADVANLTVTDFAANATAINAACPTQALNYVNTNQTALNGTCTGTEIFNLTEPHCQQPNTPNPNPTTIPVITGNGTTTNRPDANGDHRPDEPDPDPYPNRDNYVHQGEDWYEINQNTCTPLLTGYVLIGTECKKCEDITENDINASNMTDITNKCSNRRDDQALRNRFQTICSSMTPPRTYNPTTGVCDPTCTETPQGQPVERTACECNDWTFIEVDNGQGYCTQGTTIRPQTCADKLGGTAADWDWAAPVNFTSNNPRCLPKSTRACGLIKRTSGYIFLDGGSGTVLINNHNQYRDPPYSTCVSCDNISTYMLSQNLDVIRSNPVQHLFVPAIDCNICPNFLRNNTAVSGSNLQCLPPDQESCDFAYPPANTRIYNQPTTNPTTNRNISDACTLRGCDNVTTRSACTCDNYTFIPTTTDANNGICVPCGQAIARITPENISNTPDILSTIADQCHINIGRNECINIYGGRGSWSWSTYDNSGINHCLPLDSASCCLANRQPENCTGYIYTAGGTNGTFDNLTRTFHASPSYSMCTSCSNMIDYYNDPNTTTIPIANSAIDPGDQCDQCPNWEKNTTRLYNNTPGNGITCLPPIQASCNYAFGPGRRHTTRTTNTNTTEPRSIENFCEAPTPPPLPQYCTTFYASTPNGDVSNPNQGYLIHLNGTYSEEACTVCGSDYKYKVFPGGTTSACVHCERFKQFSSTYPYTTNYTVGGQLCSACGGNTRQITRGLDVYIECQ